MRRLVGAGVGLLLAGCGSVNANLPEKPKVQDTWEDAIVVQGEAGTDTAWWSRFNDPVLQALVARADQRNLDLRLADVRIREARAIASGAYANRLPELGASAGASVGRGAASPEVRPELSASLGASWELDVFGRLRNEALAAEAQAYATVADRDAVRLSLISEVARTYVEYRLFQAQREISERNAQAAEEVVRIARARFEQGVASRLEVERPLAELAQTRAQVASSVELSESARHRLVLLLATTPAELSEILPATGEVPQMDPIAVLLTPTEVISRRPDVRVAAFNVSAAVARKDAAAALRWPRISLSTVLGVSGPDLLGLLSGGALWNLGANLLAPVFDFGRIRATIEASDARQEQALLLYERVARQAVNEVQTGVVSYTQGVIRRNELENAVVSARKAAELARLQYAQGTLSLLEVIDAERTLRQSELEWSRASADVSLRAVRLYQTMGLIPPSEVAPP
jgi:NodT family efflux transporter outer membrane factor (OMF) lipoprotein